MAAAPAVTTPEPPRRIAAWACRFACGRIGTSKRRIAEHQARCFRNPARRACQTCRYRRPPEEAESDTGYPGSGPWCEKLGTDACAFDCADWEARSAA